MKNGQRRISLLWFGLSIAGILSATVLREYVIAFDLRGAVTFLGIFAFVSGAVVGRMFWRRANILDEMLKGEDVVAAFRYPEHLLQNLAAGVKEERLQANWVRFAFISLIVLVVAVFMLVLLIVDESYGVLLPLILVYAVLELLMFTAVKLSPANAYRRIIKSDGLVIIVPKGLLFCGELHIWNAFMTRLNRVYTESKKSGTALCFSYTYYVSYAPPIKNTFEVKIPFFQMDSKEIIEKVLAYF